MFQLLITFAFIPPLLVALVFPAIALVDLLKRDNTPFLAPAYAQPRRGNQRSYVPAGLVHVYSLAATYHSSSREERAWR
jgi:hypothetical protein